MKKNTDREKQLTLSIETAVEGGSLSLLCGNTEIDFWLGSKNISKAEDILEQISKLLNKNDFSRRQIVKVIVSDGLGSLTGAKIGLAIALGLKTALGCEIVCESILESLLIRANLEAGLKFIAAFPKGENQVVRQNFEIERETHMLVSKPHQILSIAEFLIEIRNEADEEIIAHRKLYETIKAVQQKIAVPAKIVDAGENCAFLIAVNAQNRSASDNKAVLY